MTKLDVRTFEQLSALAHCRMMGSLERNDPVAAAYWGETREWARSLPARTASHWLERPDAVGWARLLVDAAKTGGSPMERAILYSRAKWVVIMARNNGVVMSPSKTGVNMKSFRGIIAAAEGPARTGAAVRPEMGTNCCAPTEPAPSSRRESKGGA